MAGNKSVRQGKRQAQQGKAKKAVGRQAGGGGRGLSAVRRPTPNPGTSYSTPPSAIGAVSRGLKPHIVGTKNGQIIYGEDFVTTLSPLVAGGWATVAGFPVSPYSLGPNALSDACRMYSEWICRKLCVFYVPAIGTASNGQVAIYHKTDRSDPHINPLSSSFFNFVLSQQCGVLGPVWQPMAVEIPCSSDWRSTVPLLAVDINDDADGEVFVATNNFVSAVAPPSAGIVKIQYAFEFRNMARNPRLALIPTPLQVYFNLPIGPSIAYTTSQSAKWGVQGSDQAGTQNIPGQPNRGDVYKFIIDTGRSSLLGLGPTSFITEQAIGTSFSVTIDNGFTCYLWFDGSSFYPCKNIQSAMASMTYFNATSSSAFYTMVGMASLVGNTNTTSNTDI